LQFFLLYVRIRAKAANNRTPVTLSNPLSGLVQSQLQGPTGGNEMIKNLASSFLKSESTVLEYDLKQAQSMQGGLIFNMAFMWLLHFKMEQMQPLLINTISGLINLVYSPLFQVYVLGRNLERPFKNPAMQKYEEAASVAAQEPAEATTEETTIDALEAAEAEESGDDASDSGDVTDQEEDQEEDSNEEGKSP
jgi:Phosphate transport (Pho88)